MAGCADAVQPRTRSAPVECVSRVIHMVSTIPRARRRARADTAVILRAVSIFHAVSLVSTIPRRQHVVLKPCSRGYGRHPSSAPVVSFHMVRTTGGPCAVPVDIPGCKRCVRLTNVSMRSGVRSHVLNHKPSRLPRCAASQVCIRPHAVAGPVQVRDPANVRHPAPDGKLAAPPCGRMNPLAANQIADETMLTPSVLEYPFIHGYLGCID